MQTFLWYKVRTTFYLPSEDLKRLVKACDELGIVALSNCVKMAIDSFLLEDNGIASREREKILSAKIRVKIRAGDLERFQEICKKRGYEDYSLCFTDAVETWLGKQKNVQLISFH